MGWLAGWGSKKVLIVHLLQNHEGERYRIKTLDFRVKREDNHSILWRLVEVYDREENDWYNTIFLYILDKFSEGWGYKDQEVSMGPYLYSCPEKFVKQSKPLNQFDKNWREEYWRRKQK